MPDTVPPLADDALAALPGCTSVPAPPPRAPGAAEGCNPACPEPFHRGRFGLEDAASGDDAPLRRDATELHARLAAVSCGGQAPARHAGDVPKPLAFAVKPPTMTETRAHIPHAPLPRFAGAAPLIEGAMR